MFGLLFSRRYDDEWLTVRPDLSRYATLKEEMDERDRLNYEPPRHRRKDDSDVHPLIRYGVRVGIPSVMAACLVYWLVMKLDTKQDAALELARTHATMTTMMTEQSSRIERLMEISVALQTAQCYNDADTVDERRQCGLASR